MTPPYIPYIDPSVGENLASLGQTVGRLLRPNLEFEQQLRNALATHPELIQQLGNLAQRSPAAMSQVYGNNVASYFQSVGQSPEDRLSQQNATLQGQVISEQNQALSALPPERRQVLAKAAVETGLAGGQRPSQVNDEARIQAGQNAYSNYLRENPNFNPVDFITNLRKGNIGADIGAGALNDPEHGVLLKQLWEGQEAQERLQQQERLADRRDYNNFQRGIQSTEDQVARNLMLTAREGTLDSWRRVVRNPNGGADVEAIRAKPEAQRTPQEQDVLRAYTAYSRIDEQERRRQVLPTIDLIRKTLNDLRTTRTAFNTSRTSREDYESALQTTTSTLNEAYNLAGIPVQAEYVPFKDGFGPFNEDAKIKFYRTNANGTRTELSEEEAANIGSGSTPNPQPQTQSTDPLQIAADRIIANPALDAQLNSESGFTPPQIAEIRRRVREASTRRR